MLNLRRVETALFTCGALLISAGVALLAHPAILPAHAQSGGEIEPFTDSACLDCHTDQQRLTELAVVEEEAPEALSSGPG